MTNTKNMVLTALFIALSVLLPIGFHAIQMAGFVFLPMHIPVLLAGLACGWKFGLVTGLIAPLVSASFTGMPSWANVPPMMLELGVYGLASGLALEYIRTKRASFDLYIALVVAMLAGRIVAGIAQFVYFSGGDYSVGAWVAAYFVTGLPGLVIQFMFVPSVVMALERERVIPLRYPINA
ncbi:MAG: ECF transporter S component [Defluviitaleaceae bacterium]|nr:ECF transporter S component [Defluviitaleaceae bacterium]